ncbi:molybdopterin synthase subunit MoaD [Pyrobaculum islandicum DSM 4184]|uniref:Molybdopterin synthase subunit MoaD n=1 Tax=Pyrobaculum islandicum (strain DSM 4184 / JCM 9189 / GEO3) TaxID=384616 RepID=A1RVJ3_PYRIL|nr:MoaD/ThiS family protein [Pyrobaculum islandicum]ABL88975.1 molybdopterin synthase subunit MoaD [Pyrobaculum islandicum DSM 4184]
MAKVKLAGVLVALAGGKTELEIDGATVRDILRGLASVSQKLYERVVGPDGWPRADIYIAINDVDIRLLSGLSTPVGKEDVVLILAYIHPG